MSQKPNQERVFRTASDLVRERVYGPPGDAVPPGVGQPGEYPFTRGLHPTGYRGRPWTMRQYAGFGTAAESNRRYRYLLEQGTTGLSVAFDLPTQIGYDSDDPHSLGEVGKVGVAIDSLEDMEALFDGIPLDRVSTSMTINATAAILLALYVAVARRRGIAEDALSGTLQNDILKEYVARGTWIYPPAPSMRLVTDVFAFCAERAPKWNTISISGYHIREAGATAPQELAFTFANAIEYVRAAQKAGLDADRFGERLSFFFACHSDFLEEIAKFRAARRLWARIMKERFGVTNPKAQQCRFHVQTGGVTLTAQQPDNNVVRVALQTMAAVLGGCQSLHTNGRDEALALPTEASARLALRTQQIVAFESGAADTVDPLGGSYAVEAATDALEREALRLIDAIESRGGALAAVLGGCQSLHTNGRDEALALPTEASARLALRTQQVIAYESGAAATVDPLGGSWAIEAATDALEAEAERLVDQVEARGGARAAIERGDVQREIQESAFRHQRQVEAGERVIVGVNRFPEEGEAAPADILRIDPEVERAQVARVRSLRARRDPVAWAKALDVLEATARSGGNLVPAMVDSVLAWATVGEIANRLRGVFGEHRETLVL
jgi:methylmalonyl-CoA mutase N-terminal domain/subunit